MNNTQYTVSEAGARCISQLRALRAALWAFNYEIATDFTRASAQGWKDSGLRGVAGECFALTLVLADVPGSYDLFERARDLAARCAAAA